MDKRDKKAPQSGSTVKKPYRAPVLSQYGDVKRLTGGMMGGSGDMIGPVGDSRVCWIAEALYGVDAPRVALVRGWLARCYGRREGWALFAVPLYRHAGQRVAAALRAFPGLQRIFRPLFDRAVRRAYQEYAVQAVAQRDSA